VQCYKSGTWDEVSLRVCLALRGIQFFTSPKQSGIFVVTSTPLFTAPPYCLPVRVVGINKAFDYQQVSHQWLL
jgi:hypothetical protein